MSGMNRVTLIGNLGQKPELRFTQSNQGVLTVRMATTESYYDNGAKERKERTEWHTVVIWGKRGEALAKLLDTGDRLCVEGRLSTRSWEDKTGAKRYSTEVVATNVLLLGAKRDSSNRDAPPHDDHQGDGGPGPSDDDIPF